MDSFTFLHWISRKLQVFQECHSILGLKPKFSFPLLTESIQWSILDLTSLFIFCICESTTRSQKNDGTNTMWEAIYKFSTLGWSTQAWGLALPSCSVSHTIKFLPNWQARNEQHLILLLEFALWKGQDISWYLRFSISNSGNYIVSYTLQGRNF